LAGVARRAALLGLLLVDRGSLADRPTRRRLRLRRRSSSPRAPAFVKSSAIAVFLRPSAMVRAFSFTVVVVVDEL